MKRLSLLLILLALPLLLTAPAAACSYSYSYVPTVAFVQAAYVAPAVVQLPAPVVTAVYAPPTVSYAPAATYGGPVLAATTVSYLATLSSYQQLVFLQSRYGYSVGRTVFDHHFGARGITSGLRTREVARERAIARGLRGRR